MADRLNLGQRREDHDDHILLQDQISMAAVMVVLGEKTVLVISGSRSLP